MSPAEPCPLCAPTSETVLWSDTACRVILAAEADWPGFCRVIWHAHVAEMTDLDAADRARVMGVVFGVESALRASLAPTKVNVASLGNQVPHLHWHVIPRWADDATFPGSVWSPRQRPTPERHVDVAALTAALAKALGPGSRS